MKTTNKLLIKQVKLLEKDLKLKGYKIRKTRLKDGVFELKASINNYTKYFDDFRSYGMFLKDISEDL